MSEPFATWQPPSAATYRLDVLSVRNPKTLGVWGPNGTRPIAGEAYWRQPITWNEAARVAGERHRVFCASLADVFEGEQSMPAEAWPLVRRARRRLFDLIRRCPWLDFLLVTKRPELVAPSIEGAALDCERNDDLCEWLNAWYRGCAPPNVWLLTSVGHQAAADVRVPELLKCRHLAPVLGLSIEPLIGPLTLNLAGIDWVIVGGESGGPKARPMHPDWARSIRDQCQAAGVPFFFKQWGEWERFHGLVTEAGGGFLPEGGFMENPEITRGYPHTYKTPTDVVWMSRVGKHAAGRLLDGQTWDEFPLPLVV